MRNMSPAFRRAIFDGRADYTNTLVFTFEDDSTLTLTNDDIAMDGAKMEDAVSDDGVFQVGAVIVNSATFTLMNMEGDLDGYEFGGAQVVWYVGMDGLDDGTDATPNNGAARMGTFYVDETEYDGHVITLRCLDNAGKLNIPFEWNYTGSIAGNPLVRWVDIVAYQTGLNFPNMLYIPHATYDLVTLAENIKNATCRQVVSWVAQIAGCFVRANAGGDLVFSWFDTSALTPTPGVSLYGGYFDDTVQSTYQSGDDADGGGFNPWNTGYVVDGGDFTSYQNIDMIQSCFSQKLSLSDIEITGVKVIYKTGDGGSSAAIAEASTGTAGYVISIEDNPFINTIYDNSLQRNTVTDILGFIGSAVIGMRFRAGEIVHPSDPAIEAGDVGFYWDIHQNQHAILISSTEFSGGVTQRTVSSAASAEKNASTRYSNSTQNYVSTMAAVALAVYPVGSIYMSVNGTNPSTLFGGTWEQLKDRFLLGAGDTYANGAAGGSADAVVVSHSHVVTAPEGHTLAVNYGSGGAMNQLSATFGFSPSAVNTGGLYGATNSDKDRFFANTTGQSGTGANLPPYLVVYMWKRTA